MSLENHLTTLESSGLIRLAQMEPELEYLFRHALIQVQTIIQFITNHCPPYLRETFLSKPDMQQVLVVTTLRSVPLG